MKIKIPLVIEEPGSLFLYNSLEDAEQNLEAYDVRNNLYKGWDATGRLLSISCENKKVNISVFEADPTHINELDKVLRNHLEDVGKNVKAISRGDLTLLLNEAEVFLYTPQSSWAIIKLFMDDFVRTIFSKPIKRNGYK